MEICECCVVLVIGLKRKDGPSDKTASKLARAELEEEVVTIDNKLRLG